MDVQVINLDRDVGKWSAIQKAFRSFNLNLIRFSAVDGSTMKTRPWYMTNGMSGCLESHRRLWQQCINSKESMIVFEDDCYLMQEDADIAAKLKTLPLDFDVGVLGYLFDDRHWQTQITRPLLQRRYARQMNRDWRVPGYFAGTHAYIISVDGAKKLLKNKEVFHADALISRCGDLKLYALNESMFGQRQPGCIQIANTTLEWILMEPVIGFQNKPIRVWHMVLMSIILCKLTSAMVKKSRTKKMKLQ
jgi:GR25 family glycosyltransferase involved in LPS biosynthesis